MAGIRKGSTSRSPSSRACGRTSARLEVGALRPVVARHEKVAAKVQSQYEKGLTTDAERRQELIKIWTEATDEVQVAMRDELPGGQHHQPHGVLGCSW